MQNAVFKIVVIALALVAFGCSYNRSGLDDKTQLLEKMGKIKVGMVEKEVEDIAGKPLDIQKDPPYVVWRYIWFPKHLDQVPKGKSSGTGGFTVYFENGKVIKVDPIAQETFRGSRYKAASSAPLRLRSPVVVQRDLDGNKFPVAA